MTTDTTSIGTTLPKFDDILKALVHLKRKLPKTKRKNMQKKEE